MAIGLNPTTELYEILLGVSFFIIAFWMQCATLARLNPQHEVGDEAEVIGRARGTHRDRLWLRVPLTVAIPWFAALVSDQHQVKISRRLVSLISAVTVGIAAWYAYHLAGLGAGLGAGLLIILCMERMILAIHLWPDILLGFWLLMFSIIMSVAESPTAWGALGVVAALAFLTRIDFAILALFGWASAAAHGLNLSWSFALVAAPTVFAGLALSVRNGLTHGMWTPDSTLLFNLRVSTAEVESPGAAMQNLMHKTATQAFSEVQKPISGLNKFARIVFTNPTPFLFQAARRLHTLLGPETFASQHLIRHNLARYTPPANIYSKGHAALNIKWWFSFIFLSSIFLVPLLCREFVALIAIIILVESAVQTRSRYRMSLLPALAAHVAIAAANTPGSNVQAIWLVLSGLSAIVAAVLIFAKTPRREIETDG